MVVTHPLDFTIAGVTIRINSPVDLAVPSYMEPFQTPGITPDVIFNVELIESPIEIPGDAVYSETGIYHYPISGGWLRVYKHLADQNGVCAALRLSDDNCHTIYIPRADLNTYQTSNILSVIIGLDHVMIQQNCIFLHSSLVRYQGKAILFSGPSGVGKSTQAGLWQKFLGAEILNGDKTCIANRDGALFACGSPYAGSSDIYLREEAPLAGIVMLEQGEENILSPLSIREAFILLYAQILANTWDREYTERVCSLLDYILTQVPVYRLRCTPSQEAVSLVQQVFFD